MAIKAIETTSSTTVKPPVFIMPSWQSHAAQ
jgi:hypothetical protein